jgi:hypothetical protein
MARYADALVAVWDGQSGGTSDMIRRAKVHLLPHFIGRNSMNDKTVRRAPRFFLAHAKSCDDEELDYR